MTLTAEWLDWSLGSLLIALILFLMIRAVWEPTQLDLTWLKSKAIQRDALRILHLSDLHAEKFRIRPARLIALAEKCRPDLIVFTGDLCAKPKYDQKALNLMAALRRSPGLADVPFAAVRGNHDDPHAFHRLSSLGIRVLVNQSTTVRKNSRDYLICGLDDLKTGQPDSRALFDSAEQSEIGPAMRVVIAHNPDTLLDLPEQSAGLFLAGHFHGGQIRTPFHLEFWVLRGEMLPKMGYRRGYFTLRGIQSYISRGLGCVALPFRLFSKPEAVLIDYSPNQPITSVQTVRFSRYLKHTP